MMKTGHQFVVMWCNEGLEYVGDVTADNQRVVWEQLQGRESPRHALANPFHLRLRAQYNLDRHYEIYFIEAQEGIGEEEIRQMFCRDPQGAADLIRSKGECFYSNRAEKTAVIV
jgi:hypothetical protein